MSDELIVLTASTVGPDHPESGTLALYLSQLDAAGIDHDCEKLTDFPGNGGSLQYKIGGLRRRVVQHLNYDKIIFTDGHDVTFYGDKDSVFDKIPDAGVLLGAERNCYPEAELARLINNPLPWRYANAGWLAGTPESFMLWFDAIERHPQFAGTMLDQAFFNRLLAANDPLVMIDDHCDLCYCFFGETHEIHDLQFDEQGLPINTLTMTRPAFLHQNGRWCSDHIWARRSLAMNDNS